MSSGETPLRCPVCRASFRGTPECSRCGARLEPLMVLAAKAHRLRRAARHVLQAGDFHRARELVREAHILCATESGRKLLLLTEWLCSARSTPHRGSHQHRPSL